MGYYAEGEGVIYFNKKLSQEERDMLIEKFREAAEFCTPVYGDFENTVFDIYLEGKYHEEYVIGLLSRLTKILPIESGEIKYFGEDNTIWRFIFDKNQNKWLEQEANITFPEPTTNEIYTHDEATRIIELFEDILDKYNISIPSPEDDERGKDNMVGLYGTTYSDLLDDVESVLIDIAEQIKNGAEIITNEYSGNY